MQKNIDKRINNRIHDWFGSEYYRLLYKNRDEKEAEFFLDNLIKHLHLKKGSRILDMACGRGRHSGYLEKQGFDVTGIDISEESISFAKNKSNAEFYVHDMRIVFKKKHFDAVLNLFTSFGYFDSEKEDVEIFKAVFEELKPGGIFVLDFLNVKKIIPRLVREEIKTVEGVKFEIKRYVSFGFIWKKIKVGKNLFEEKVKILSVEDFRKYFSETGFQITGFFGDYELNGFNEKKSDRLIIIAKKIN